MKSVQTEFILGAQYFRPPFPRPSDWEEDLKAMRDSAGLNTVQLWLLWSWCEPAPGKFVFDDYDRLSETADKLGLGLILSTLPEINPFWVPRVHPDALMVDVEGNIVRNCNRWECISGLVPGACSDHPDIRKRMTDFLVACGEHYAGCQNLIAWDCWNENRWRNMAPDMVCFCDHSRASLNTFLENKYDSLEGLSRAWGRKYCDWADVQIGRLYSYSYPEMHDYTEWLCWRAADMAAWRTEALRLSDPNHPVSNHTGNPTVNGGTNLDENIFSRGVDWDVAPGDTYGFSSFPKSLPGKEMRPEQFCLNINSVQTVAGDKPIWMSELQGGPVAIGEFGPPLTGAEQQNWVWTGIARGCKAVLFWCWKPEVFGLESNGFGITSTDGYADDRLAKLRQTSEILAAKGDLVRAYKPAPLQVALLFQRDSTFYGWMNQQHKGYETNAVVENFKAYAYALEQLNIPYSVLDDRHLGDAGDVLKLVVVPDPEGLHDEAAKWLTNFAQGGGTVFIEGGAGARGPDTYLRGPGARPFYQLAGIEEELYRGVTRETRTLPSSSLKTERGFALFCDKLESTFAADQDGVACSPEDDGLPIWVNRPFGRGRILALGSIIGKGGMENAPEDFCNLLRAVVAEAGVQLAVSVLSGTGNGDAFTTARIGKAGDKALLFVNHYGDRQEVTVSVDSSLLSTDGKVTEWFGLDFQMDRHADKVHLSFVLDEFGVVVFEW